MLRNNLIANLFSNVWGVISVFLFVPLYIKFLGIEAYGLVGFYATLIGFLSLADMGFTMTLKRETARLSALFDWAGMKNLLRTYELIYCFIAVIVSLMIWLLAPIISEHFLKTTFFKPFEMINAIRLMGISISIQLPAGLFIGGLMGLQRQVLGNFLNIGVGILRGVGAITILYFFPPTIFTFFIWQLFSNLMYLYFSRTFLWRIIISKDLTTKAKFQLDVIYKTGHFALNMAIMSIIGVLLSQADKIIVGKYATLIMFSYYSVAGSVASIPIMIAGAIGTAIFPQLAELVAINNTEELKKIYILANELIGLLVVPIVITLIFFSSNFIAAWTGSFVVSKNAGLVAAFLLIGQLLQSITVIPYNYALAFGNVKFSQKIGVYSIVLITPLLIFLTMRYGIIGAAISWLVLNMISFPINVYFLHKQKLLVNEKMWRHCMSGVMRPLLICVSCALLFKFLFSETSSRIIIVIELGIVWIVSSVLVVVILPGFRSALDLIFNFRAVKASFTK